MTSQGLISRPRLFLTVLLAAGCATATTLPAAAPASDGPSASSPAADAAKRKRCGKGKTRVRRKGRKSVCAKKCRRGFKHKVSKRGKVSCARKPKRGESKRQSGGGGPAAGNYTGTTAQNRPLKFTVSGGQVTGFEAGVNTYCSTQGNQRVVFDAIANVPPMAIGPGGTFSYDGPPSSGNAKIRGRITGGSATGAVGMNRGDTNYSGGQFYFGACTASDVAWSAKSG
jgi:hypothetical protein